MLLFNGVDNVLSLTQHEFFKNQLLSQSKVLRATSRFVNQSESWLWRGEWQSFLSSGNGFLNSKLKTTDIQVVNISSPPSFKILSNSGLLRYSY